MIRLIYEKNSNVYYRGCKLPHLLVLQIRKQTPSDYRLRNKYIIGSHLSYQKSVFYLFPFALLCVLHSI